MDDGVTMRLTFGERTRSALTELGISPLDLATRSRLPKSRIQHILRGQLVRITLRDMALIASVLGTPLFSLIGPVESAVIAEAFEIAE